jgi:hypothetical protein
MNPWQAFVLVVLTIVAVGSNASPGSSKRPRNSSGSIKKVGSSAKTCRDLLGDLRAMRLAQKTLLSNMVENNETMATTLEDYSVHLKEVSRIKRPISIKDVSSLHQSASAFRAHRVRESQLVSKFNVASDSLVARIETCLSKNREASN